MTKMRATPAMIAAVKGLPPERRLAAAKLAERVFFSYLSKTHWDDPDFTREQHIELAGDAAADEVMARFERRH